MADEQGAGPEGEGEPREAAREDEPRAPRRASPEPLGEMVTELLGRIWRRSRVEMERAARRGKDRLTLRQLRADRDRMYQKLGKEARQLLESGDFDHPGLKRGVERIRELEARLLEAEDAVRQAGGNPDEPEPPPAEVPEAS